MEQELCALLAVGEVLGGLYVGKPRKVDLVWSRYLQPALQHKFLMKERGVSETVRRQVEELFALTRAMDSERDVLYFIVPREGKWYAGRVKGRRLRGKASAPGVQVRMVEHVAGVASSGRDRDQTKYRQWRAIGVDAVAMLPICSQTPDKIRSLEEYVIS